MVKRNDSRISTFITLKVLNVEIRESFRFALSCECLTCTCMYSFISNNYLPDVAVAYSKCYPQLLGNGKLCLETGGADLQCILSLFCSPNTDRARFQRLCPNELTKWRENRENLVPNVKTADSCLFRIEHSQGCFVLI